MSVTGTGAGGGSGHHRHYLAQNSVPLKRNSPTPSEYSDMMGQDRKNNKCSEEKIGEAKEKPPLFVKFLRTQILAKAHYLVARAFPRLNERRQSVQDASLSGSSAAPKKKDGSGSKTKGSLAQSRGKTGPLLNYVLLSPTAQALGSISTVLNQYYKKRKAKKVPQGFFISAIEKDGNQVLVLDGKQGYSAEKSHAAGNLLKAQVFQNPQALAADPEILSDL